MSGDVRPINVNMDIPRFILSGWLAAVSLLVVVILFRQASVAPQFKAATIDSSRLITDVRRFVKTEADYPELVEVEVMEFLKYVQVEMNDLTDTQGVSIVLSSSSVLAGEFEDYTDYIYLHAKSAYEEGLLGRTSAVKRPGSQLASVAGEDG